MALCTPVLCPGQDEYVRAFSEPHFEGRVTVFTPVANHPELRDFDNRISSLIYKMPPGRVAVFYVDKRYEGPALELHGTGYPVRMAGLDLYERNLSSLRWDSTAGIVANEQGAFARLYQRKNFKGARLTVTFNENIANLRQVTGDEGERGFENEVESARWLIPEGWNLVLYENRDFSGDAIELQGSANMESSSTLERFEGRASSLRWEPARFQAAPPGPPPVISPPPR